MDRSIRRWPYQRGTIARILKRNALPIEDEDTTEDVDDEEDRLKRAGGLFLRTSKSLQEPWKNFNRYGRAGMFLRASKSLEFPSRQLRRHSGLFLRTSRGSNGFFLRTAKDAPLEDLEEELGDRMARSSTGMFLRNF